MASTSRPRPTLETKARIQDAQFKAYGRALGGDFGLPSTPRNPRGEGVIQLAHMTEPRQSLPIRPEQEFAAAMAYSAAEAQRSDTLATVAAPFLDPYTSAPSTSTTELPRRPREMKGRKGAAKKDRDDAEDDGWDVVGEDLDDEAWEDLSAENAGERGNRKRARGT